VISPPKSPPAKITGLNSFLVDYFQRHAHPVNAVLHLLGVPMAFTGLWWCFSGNLAPGLLFLFLGYLLQYLGHKAQGNEVGEVTLIKSVWRRLKTR
jgi:hypothetical protein